ncbi:ABC transporter permease [Ramlibacter sp.]|uniref:ABC transporter permease n=1 Tax=Ramlibacter sp. TaxID=1917967 RepID=UPI0035AEE557
MTAKPGREAFIYLGPALLLAVLVVLAPLAFVLYTSLFVQGSFSLEAYKSLWESALFRRALVTTFEISAMGAVLSLLLGYPVALHLSRLAPRPRAFCMILVLVPFWTSILVKSYAFTVLLGKEGVVNSVLVWAFGSGAQIPMLFNRAGVMIGMTNYLIPFVVFPVLASLLAIDRSIYRAVEIMGAKPPTVFWKVTLPLSMPGVASALISTFVMATGFFVIPALLGGRKDLMLANLVDFYTRETLDWNMAAAIGVILLAIVTLFAGTAMQLQKMRGSARGV